MKLFPTGFWSTGIAMVLIFGLWLIAPACSIWALNTLSEQTHWGWHIPHKLITYVAVSILYWFNFANFGSEKDKK